MTCRIILCRHGNTFGEGDRVVMVGANEDLPLTSRGLEQAATIGESLRVCAASVSRFIAGPLKRTVEFAKVVQDVANIRIPFKVDERLVELDYGEWGGLSNEQIVTLSGEEALYNWQCHGKRPEDIVFQPAEDTLARETQSVLDECSQLQGVTVVITSNGRLREYARIVEQVGGSGAKVKTGHACILEYSDDRWQSKAWNITAEQLRSYLLLHKSSA